mmetsp:Transcript_59945/g.99500  ORF Transcript_59945/g.99500 Transcript_59945/m.99500 type:complete len:115 (+) Transcript_59945:138-482(+)
MEHCLHVASHSAFWLEPTVAGMRTTKRALYLTFTLASTLMYYNVNTNTCLKNSMWLETLANQHENQDHGVEDAAFSNASNDTDLHGANIQCDVQRKVQKHGSSFSMRVDAQGIC